MATASGSKRLDEVEVYLTPKEWAIWLAGEMRKRTNETDFWQEVVTGPYREVPWFRPLFKLGQQAEAQHPGKRSEDIQQRIQLDHKHRTEFQTLKIFIGRINRIIDNKCEKTELKIELAVWQLNLLSWQGDFSHVAKAAAACIEPTVERNLENRILLEALKACADSPQADLIELVAKDFARLVVDIFDHDAALRLAQDQYFDGHPILFLDVESRLSKVIEMMRDAVVKFNAFLGERANLEVLQKMSGPIDVGKIMKYAEVSATLDILLASGANHTYCWEIYRAMREEECKPLELPAATKSKR